MKIDLAVANEAQSELADQILDLIEQQPLEQQVLSIAALTYALGVVLATYSQDQDHLVAGIEAVQRTVRATTLDTWAALLAGLRVKGNA